MPLVTSRYDDVLAAADAPRRLWRRAVGDVGAGRLDDRPLYWARLKLLRDRQGDLAGHRAERQSRGFDIGFPPGEPAALVVGFDPFHLVRDLGQCNPSGVAALALHGARIAGANVRAAILPVRFADFDRGVVEELLTPVFRREPAIVFALTISMGRRQMELERFPGRRRSARTADNRGVRSGASPERPLAPPGLAGPEFVEFTLPATAMVGVSGHWRVRDNRRVRTLERGAVVAGSLAELADDSAVAGSAGGFLSNEVAYRSLLLRRRLGGRFALGHLHTPAIRGHDRDALVAMVEQIRRIVRAGIAHARRET